MGLGDYISSQSELDWSIKERKREEWEFQHVKNAEIEEMKQIYIEKGVAEEDAEEILERMAKYDQFFIDHMMVMELGIMPPDADDSPAKSGAVTFGAFLLFGSIPLLAYLIFHSIDFGEKFQTMGTFVLAAVITGVSLFLLGVLKGRLVGSKSIRSGFWVLLNGGLAAVAAFVVAYLFSLAVPDECEITSDAISDASKFFSRTFLANASAGVDEPLASCILSAMDKILDSKKKIDDIPAFCESLGYDL